MSETEFCDYCGEQMGDAGFMRAVGFARLTEDGNDLPQVKTWCGLCQTPDDIDASAHLALLDAIEDQRRPR